MRGSLPIARQLSKNQRPPDSGGLWDFAPKARLAGCLVPGDGLGFFLGGWLGGGDGV